MELPQHPRVAPLTISNVLARKVPAVPAVPAVHGVTVAATVREALAVLAEHDVGAVLVLDGERVAGIFSERDYVRLAFVRAGIAGATSVSQVMTPCTVFATPTQTVQSCLDLMNEKRLQYLPVIEDGKPLALPSIADLLKATIAHYERISQAHALDQRIMFLQGTYSC